MKKIEKYMAADGSLFDTEADALSRDKLLTEMDQAYKLLNPIPTDDGCRFANGHGYVQQDPQKVLEVQAPYFNIGSSI